MTVSPEDVALFKVRIPEFVASTDDVIEAALDEADMWLDASKWNPADFPWARVWLAAHNLKLAQTYADIATDGSSGGSSSVGMFVRSISFGERRVQFGERKLETSASAGAKGPGEELFEETIYGLKFVRLRSRNIPCCLTV